MTGVMNGKPRKFACTCCPWLSRCVSCGKLGLWSQSTVLRLVVSAHVHTLAHCKCGIRGTEGLACGEFTVQRALSAGDCDMRNKIKEPDTKKEDSLGYASVKALWKQRNTAVGKDTLC